MGALVAIVSGFAGGVGVRSLFVFGWEPMAFVLILAAILLIVPKLLSVYSLAPLEMPARSEPDSKRVLSLTGLGAVFFVCIAFGMGRAAIADTPPPEAFVRDLKHRVQYAGVVVGDPDVREKNQRIAIEVTPPDGEQAVGMLAVMPLSARVAVGDRVRVYGTLSLPQAFETDGGRTFRYDKYLQARNIRFLIQFGSIRVEESPVANASVKIRFLTAFARIKHAFLDGLARALPKPASALAGGIVIGGKQGLGTELKDAFTRSGLVQIIVLSGYNVMIVAEWVMAFVALFALPRRLQFFAGGAALLLFVGIAGFSATAIRAMCMALIALYARATARTYIAGRALLFVVLLMLIWNPLYLIFDPGFGLSVAATAGIIWLAPKFEMLWERCAARFRRVSQVQRHPRTPSGVRGLSETLSETASGSAINSFLRNTVATTLAAQISVLPLLLYNIGLFSLVALPANILVNPLVPLAMASAAIAGVVGMTLGSFVPMLAIIVGTSTHLLMRYFIFIAEQSAALPYAAFTLDRFPFLLVLVAYGLLIYLASAKRFSTTPQLRFAKNASM